MSTHCLMDNVATMKHYLDVLRNKIIKFAGNLMELEIIRIGEFTQIPKGKGCIFLLMCG